MIKQFVESLSQLPQIGFSDIFEIIIIIFIIYKLTMLLKNTRAWIVLKGLGILYVSYAITDLLSLHVLSEILKFATLLTVFVVILALQPDIRRIIEKIGNKKITDFSFINSLKTSKKELRFSDNTIDALVHSLMSLSKTKTGALIVIEKDTPLNDIIASGININADVSSQLIGNIFVDKTPLHDGAVVIRGDKILSATAYLPLSNNLSIDKELGTRHRAAIGATEASDCFVLVCSEETGQVSFVKNGIIKRNLDEAKLRKLLQKEQNYENQETKKYSLFDNSGIKISSILIGVLIWIVMINTIDPVTTKEFKNIKINTVNSNVLPDKTIELEKDKVDITLEDRRSVLSKIKFNDINATADFKKLSISNAVEPNINIRNNSSSKIIKISDSIINTKIDEIGYLEVPIETNLIGKTNNNISLKTIMLMPEQVTISGGKNLLRKIGKVVCDVQLNRIYEDKEFEYIPKIYDKNGDEIGLDRVKISENTFFYKAITQPIKEIPINIKLSDGQKSAGKISDFDYFPKSISIVGSKKDLSKIKSLQLDIPIEINITDAVNKKMTKIININDYLSEEFKTANNDDKVEININYDPYPTKKAFLSKENIIFKGKNAQFDYSIDEYLSIPVSITGPQDIINNINLKNIKAEIDVSAFTVEGKYKANISYLNNNVLVTSNINDISVKIVKKAED